MNHFGRLLSPKFEISIDELCHDSYVDKNCDIQTAKLRLACPEAVVCSVTEPHNLNTVQIQALAKDNPKFAAVDKAIGRQSLKVVTLLRLSPLLPLAVSNYFYGLTSVDLGSYVLGSWLGMLPGTIAYVTVSALPFQLFTGHALQYHIICRSGRAKLQRSSPPG